MADTTEIGTQRINELATTNSPANSDVLIIDTASGTRIINYSDLADAILNKLASKSYSMGGSTQTIMSAISSINSQISTINSKINNTSSSSGGANYAHTGWGTSASLQASGNRNQFLVMADGYLFTVWFSGSSNSADLSVRAFADGKTGSGSGSVTVGGVTFSRSGTTLTVSAGTSSAIAIIG